ncbi:hypothetical protein EMELA_v1c06640 [Mesoplasma melaleucae]|uniref:Uncharacterized protein n=1 Tax=Mesoplasma melaleucae TaxID=81459 RepID=A0A2K8NZK5_9MOLU|nr:hypothetical protein EMELA_v1c06640 [Mesoplasma melaleucae]
MILEHKPLYFSFLFSTLIENFESLMKPIFKFVSSSVNNFNNFPKLLISFSL